MKARLYFLTVFLFFSCLSYAQMQEPVSFSVVSKKGGEKELSILFEGTVEKGWHVYGTDIEDGGPTRATLTVEQLSGLEPEGELQATGNLVHTMDEVFGMEVSYMEGKAGFAQKYKILSDEYSISGYLTYGACNNENCIPPTDVPFRFSSDETKEAKLAGDEDEAAALSSTSGFSKWWHPVVEELRQEGQDQALDTGTASMWHIFLMGILGGFVALLTPCVWPIIPMTVSFFLKRNGNRKRGIMDAFFYGVDIVLIYLALGLLVTLIGGASALNNLSTNAFFNIFFFLLLLAFAASFFGAFDISLPSSWSNAVDSKAGKTSGLLSIFFMAFTLSLVSFSCTGPIIGLLLVEVSTTGSIAGPAVGMLGFAVALALPFTIFALFPSWLKSLPKSGSWMNCVKMCLGFFELAFSLKFLSVADLTHGWHILDRETFLCLWIVIFALLGAYFMKWFVFSHEEDDGEEGGRKVGVIRFFLALASFAFSLYMVPGLWGAPCKAVSAFAPPLSTQDFNLYEKSVSARFYDYDEGMAYAEAHGMPVMLDFTGYGCVNCRKMEAAVWTDPKVSDLMNQEYVLITLFVDERTPLPSPIVVSERGTERKLRTMGAKWSYLQQTKFGANAQPFYVLLDNEGLPLSGSYSYNEDATAFRDFLEKGLRKYERR